MYGALLNRIPHMAAAFEPPPNGSRRAPAASAGRETGAGAAGSKKALLHGHKDAPA